MSENTPEDVKEESVQQPVKYDKIDLKSTQVEILKVKYIII